MRLLAIETCNGICSVAVYVDGKLVSLVVERSQNRQAERLLVMVEEAMYEAGISYDALDLIAVAVGPGSFTGIRIGVATANALSIATPAKVIAVSCLEAIAHRVGYGVCAVLDAGPGKLYAQKFSTSNAITDITVIDQDELRNFAGSMPIIGNKMVDEIIIPTAEDIAELALRNIKNMKEGLFCKYVQPMYIRPPSAMPVGHRA